NLIEVVMLAGAYRYQYPGRRLGRAGIQPHALEARLAGLEARHLELSASLEASNRAVLRIAERLEVLCQALLEGRELETGGWALQRAYHQGPVAAFAHHGEHASVAPVESGPPEGPPASSSGQTAGSVSAAAVEEPADQQPVAVEATSEANEASGGEAGEAARDD